jgi:cyanate permease
VAPKQAGRVIGFTNTVGTLFGFFGTALVGAIHERTGSFHSVFLVTGAVIITIFIIIIFILVMSGVLIDGGVL